MYPLTLQPSSLIATKTNIADVYLYIFNTFYSNYILVDQHFPLNAFHHMMSKEDVPFFLFNKSSYVSDPLNSIFINVNI